MDDALVAGWIARLSTADADERATLLASLRAETNLDWGDDVATWQLWWTEHVKQAARPPERISMLRPFHHALAAALAELGITADEEDLLRWGAEAAGLDHIVRSYVLNKSVGSIYVAGDDGDSLARDIERVLGIRVTLPGDRIVHGERTWPLVDRRRDLLAFVRDVAGDGRRPVIDELDRLWLLDASQLAAWRRTYPVRLRKLDEARPGAPHPDVEAARRRLDALGLDGLPAAETLGWEMLEHEPSVDGRAWSYEAQILDSADIGVACGPEIFDEDVPNLVVRVAAMTGARLGTRRGDLASGVEAMNRDLAKAKSPLHVLALAVPRGRVRLVPMPWERVGTLVTLFEVVAGATVPERRGRPRSERITLQRSRHAEDVVRGLARVVMDAERVDDPTAYESVITELVELTAGAIQIDAIEIHAAEFGARIEIAAYGKRWRADVGGSDYIDVGPVLGCLNAIAAHGGARRRFHEYRELDWGQEIGFVWIDKAELAALRASGHVDG